MLTAKLINPDLIRALAACGHGDKILIADGNYPLASRTECDEDDLIYLGLTAGIPTVTDVLEALHSVCEFEKAVVMMPDHGDEPEIFEEFRKELPGVVFEKAGRYEFYDLCAEDDVKFAVSTGEKRTFANILLTIGCA